MLISHRLRYTDRRYYREIGRLAATEKVFVYLYRHKTLRPYESCLTWLCEYDSVRQGTST